MCLIKVSPVHFITPIIDQIDYMHKNQEDDPTMKKSYSQHAYFKGSKVTFRRSEMPVSELGEEYNSNRSVLFPTFCIDLNQIGVSAKILASFFTKKRGHSKKF